MEVSRPPEYASTILLMSLILNIHPEVSLVHKLTLGNDNLNSSSAWANLVQFYYSQTGASLQSRALHRYGFPSRSLGTRKKSVQAKSYAQAAPKNAC
jgi:hypothetical protein